MENAEETYRIKDFLGYTKLLVYKRKYNPDGFDATGQRGCYDETLGIKAIGTVNEK